MEDTALQYKKMLHCNRKLLPNQTCLCVCYIHMYNDMHLTRNKKSDFPSSKMHIKHPQRVSLPCIKVLF